MLKHYLKYAIRNFRSNRLVFAGSIATVFLGVLCISLLASYIYNELSMDNFHKREKDIYLLTVQQSSESQIEVIDAKLFFGFNFKDYVGVENLTTVKRYPKGEIVFQYGTNSTSPEGIVADSTFFDIFDFGLKVGDKHTVLHDPDAVLITENLARRMFGNEDPFGKVIKMAGRNERNYTVKGILEPMPPNSSILFDFILPSHSAQFSRSGANFILVGKAFSKTDFAEKIKTLGHKHQQFTDSRMDVKPFADIYFEGEGLDYNGIISKFGNKRNISTLYGIILVIFIISLLNFSNLQIININSSIKNIGINKISGAGKQHIFYQKIAELAILIILSALLLSAAFVIALPYFSQIVEVVLSPGVWQIFLLNIVLLTILVATAMIYPAFVFSRISATRSLKNQIFTGNQLAGRNVVATAQFALSLVLLIASFVVAKQLNLLLKKDLGFTTENIINVKLLHEPNPGKSREESAERFQAYQNNYQFVKNELATHSSIKTFGQGVSPIHQFQMPWKIKGDTKDYATANCLDITPEYMKVLGLTVVEGRFFERDRDKSRGQKVVINEAAKKFWGIGDISQTRILNKYWSMPEMGSGDGYEIIGVVKDFHSEHLSMTPQPLVMVYFDDADANFLIQFENGVTQAGIQFVEGLFNKINPGETFEFTFLSDDIHALYAKEKRLSEIYILFTIIAYAISAIGLFAISLYDTRRRTKEIGVRKVNGAKVSEVMTMLNRDFVRWVAIAFIIATPIAYYAMNKWLENFAYKTTLSWWIFALAGLLAMGIALLTVSWQSWRAATRNPVEALRYE